MFADDFNLYDISGLCSNSLKVGEDKYETLPNQKNGNKDERIYYNFCYEGVRDEIGEVNSTASVYAPLANINKGNKWSKWQEKGDNKTILHIEFNNGNPNHAMNEGEYFGYIASR